MKIIIIGAVAGGASAAARLRRMDEQANILIFEKGDYISYANCGLPYYIGNVIHERNKLFIQTASSFQQRFHIDVRVRHEVISIQPDINTVTVRNLNSGDIYHEGYDKLVLSPGADPIRPALPGSHAEGIFTLRNVNDTDNIKNFLQTNDKRKAMVVGAGFIGLEMAENLHALGLEVNIVEMGNQVMPPLDYPLAATLQQHIRSKGIGLFLKSAVTGFTQQKEQIHAHLQSGETLEADLVILCIGVRPDTKLAKAAGLKIGTEGGIWVNEFLQTSHPDIYALGDAIEFPNPMTHLPMMTYLAGPANKQGRIVADNIVLGNSRIYRGSINTAIVQVFDMTVATTGLSGKQLKNLQIPHIISTIQNGSHAGYYPGAKTLTIQVAFSPDNGRLYGAQVIGYEGVDKRIDVLAATIRHQGSIHDLVEFEHAYAPPFSSAKDPINMAGFVGENILLDRLKIFYWDELENKKATGVLVDVRTPEEFSSGHIAEAINIPLDEIRGRLSEFPTESPIYLYCEAGLRGYLAQRILRQSGLERVFNLSGGYVLWKRCQTETLLLPKDQ